MRTTQYIGLNPEAEAWLAKNCKSTTSIICPTCGNVTLPELISTNLKEITGMFNEHVDFLRQYETHTGEKVETFIQAEPWSSGPCIFLALKYSESGIAFCLWGDEEINNA